MALIIADAQFGFRKRLQDAKLTPFHDRRVLDIALQIANYAKPDRVIWPGDNVDMSQWTSRYPKSPEFYWTTRPALLEWHFWLTLFRVQDKEMTIEVMDGNHEDRMRKQMLDHLPEALGLGKDDYNYVDSQVADLFHIAGLDTLGIRFIGDYPNGFVRLNEEVIVTHGEGSKMRVGGNYGLTVCGHYHRTTTLSETRWGADGPRTLQIYCPGCTCQLDGPPGRNNHPNWQQALALIHYTPHGTDYGITHIPIQDGRAIYDGKLFVGSNRIGDIRKSFPDWNW
jgi:hypothetical protein